MNTGLPPENWDTKLQHLDGSFLQSRAWAEFQTRLGREVVWAQGEGWQWLAALHKSHKLRYALCAYGPSANDEGAMAAAIASLHAAGATLHADFVRFEPQRFTRVQKLHKLGAQPISDWNPKHTQVIDLLSDEETLRANLASGHRNLINGTERRGITIRSSRRDIDFELFLDMLRDTAARSQVSFHPASYFKTLWESFNNQKIATLYLAEADGKPVAAALFYDWNGIRYYAHAGAYQERNRQVKASVSLVWQAIIDARANGQQQFDLWGVAPAGDSAHKLASLSRFKTAFGGSQVDYAGTWDLPLNPLKYRLYKAYRAARGHR